VSLRFKSERMDHAGWMRSAKKSILVAGVAIAAAELIRRVTSRFREKRVRGEFVSDNWIAEHMSSHGDGYLA
jgi:hypothetical protein